MKKISFLFCIIFISLILSSCGDTSNESSESGNTTEEATHDVCPHCNGAGERVNNMTGAYGVCNSCQGKGIVPKDNNLAE